MSIPEPIHPDRANFSSRPGDDHDERHVFTDDDPFFSEVSNFIDAIESGPEPHILSSYEDAVSRLQVT